MRHLGFALVVVVCSLSVALAAPKKAPKGAKPDPKADKAKAAKDAAKAATDALKDEINKLSTELGQAQSKQQHALAIKLAKKIYDLQVKASTGAADSFMVDIRLQQLGLAYYSAGDYVNAEKTLIAYNKATEKRSGANSQEMLNALLVFQSIYNAQERYDDTEKVLQRILAINEAMHGKQSKEYAEALSALGSHAYLRGMYSASIQYHEDALRIYEAITPNKDDQVFISPLLNLGMMLWFSNQQPKAIPLYDRAIKVAENAKDMMFVTRIATMSGISGMYLWGGRKDLGEPVMKKAIAMAQGEIARIEKAAPQPNTTDYMMLPSYYTMLGGMYRQLEDFANAEATYLKANDVYKKMKIDSNMDMAIADIKRVQGKSKEALALYESAKAQMSKLSPGAGVTYNAIMAEVLLDMKDYAQAEKVEQEYIQYAAKKFGKTGIVYGSGEMQLARILSAANNLKPAQAALEDGLEIMEKEMAKKLKIGTDADHAVYFSQHSYELEQALNFNIAFQPNSGSAARLALTTLLRRKGRLLDAAAAALATIRKNLSPNDQKVLDELASARAQLAKLTVAGPQGSGDPATFAKDVAALEDQVSRLEAQVSKLSAAYRTVSQPVVLTAIQKAIPKDARLIEIVNYQPYDPRKTSMADIMAKRFKARRYAAYVVGNSGDPIAVDLGDAAPIEAAIEKFRKALADPDNDQAAELGHQLFTLTMGKIIPKLGSATNILVAPDGALNVVPFSALVDDKKQFLIAKYTFTYLTSGRDLLRLNAKTKAKGGGILFADPQFDSTGKAAAGSDKTRGTRSADLASFHWPQLPGTAAEADAVTKAFKKFKVYRGADATEGTLKKIQAPEVLHLATHGFFLPDEAPPPSDDNAPAGAPMPGGAAPLAAQAQQYENPLLRSGLALAGANKLSSGDDDGLLTALEASGLDLEGTKLVVLSACETGVGKVTNGDGVYGLRRSLVIAGAQSLVMSLWQVDDFATKELMTGLYKGLTDGKPRNAALRDSQIKLLSNPKYAHPFYWAAFVGAGSTAPLKD